MTDGGDYNLGILNGLRNIFLDAYHMIKVDSFNISKQIDKQNLIKQWNDEIYRLNKILNERWNRRAECTGQV
jgi:hypothetical protein